jgi:hypothetical protein
VLPSCAGPQILSFFLSITSEGAVRVLFEPLISQLVHVPVVLILHHAGDAIDVLLACVQI